MGDQDYSEIPLSAMQAQCLDVLLNKSLPDGEFCLPFRPIEQRTGLSRTDVKRSVRALARKGLAAFYQGLTTDEGALAGAGYCITREGVLRATPPT